MSRPVKEALELNVEIADPARFLPMPAGRETRLSYVGRFGSVDFFLDDPYAMALSKLARGNQRDLNDIRLLAAARLIDLATIETKAREIADPSTSGSAGVDLDKLLARLSFVREN
jgi:hypothetical protein